MTKFSDSINELNTMIDGREMVHKVTIKGKTYDVRAASMEDLRKKLKELEEFNDDDGA